MNASSEPIRIGKGSTMLAIPASQHPSMIVMRFRDVGPRMATWSPGTRPRACNDAPTTRASSWICSQDTNESPDAGATEGPTNRTPVAPSAAAVMRSTMPTYSDRLPVDMISTVVARRGLVESMVDDLAADYHRGCPEIPLHRRARPGDRTSLAGPVGSGGNVRDTEPDRSAGGRRCTGPSSEDLRARHVPVSIRFGPPRRPSTGLHRYRHLQPIQADDRPQRDVHDGVRRVRSARRAVRGRNGP